MDAEVHQRLPFAARMTYSPTELGVSLAGPLTELIQWFGQHGDELLAAQKHYDSQQASPRG